MAITYLDSQMVEQPAYFERLLTSGLTAANMNVPVATINNSQLTNITATNINFPQNGGFITNDTSIFGDLTVTGSLVGLSGFQVVSTIYTTTTALSVVNQGTGIPLFVSQDLPSEDSVAEFKSNNATLLKINSSSPDNGQPAVEIFYPTNIGPALKVSNSASNNALIVASNGFVGIGTSTPSNRLQVAGTTTTVILTALSGIFTELNALRIASTDIESTNLNVASFNTSRTVANSSYNVLLTAERTNINNLVATQLTANNIFTSNLHALTANIEVIDVKFYEMSGFNIQGSLTVSDNVTTNSLSANAAYIPSIIGDVTGAFTGSLIGEFTGIANATGQFSGLVQVNSTVPTTSTSPGAPGRLAFDGDFFYVCVSADIWKRVALSEWN